MTAYPSILKAAHAERGMRWMIIISLCLHLCLLAAILGKPPDKGKTIYFNPAYTVELIGTGGALGLPDAEGPASDSPDASSSNAPTTKAAPLWKGPSHFTSKTKTIAERTHTPLKTVPTPQAPSLAKTGTAGPPSARTQTGPGQTGPQATRGGGGGIGGTGHGLTPEQARFGRYYVTVFNKIQSAWILPHYQEQKNIMAIVEITIRSDGRIVTIQFEKKSGNVEFDRSVMRAIQKVDPLPPLPAGIREPLLTLGIRFQ